MRFYLIIILTIFSCYSINASQRIHPEIEKKVYKEKGSKKDFSSLEKKIFEEAEREVHEIFQKGALTLLDPLVGDTSCQIRALEIAHLFMQYKKTGKIEDSQMEFLKLCRILTKSKELVQHPDIFLCAKERTNIKKLNGFLTSHHGDGFIKNLQKRLAEMSVRAIQVRAKDLDNKDLIAALSVTKVDNNVFKRIHCACYPTIKTMLCSSFQHSIPIMIKLDHYKNDSVEKYAFLFSNVENKFAKIEMSDLDSSMPIIVVDALSSEKTGEAQEKRAAEYQDVEQRFDVLNIYDAILTAVSTHAQFVGKENADTDIPFDLLHLDSLKNEINVYRKKAPFGFMRNEKGGPYVFIPNHIYASTIKEQLLVNKSMQKKKTPAGTICLLDQLSGIDLNSLRNAVQLTLS